MMYLCCVIWCVVGEFERVLWCGGCREKREEANTQSNKKQKRTFAKTTFSLFPFFRLFFFHSFLLAFHSSTITPFLSIHSPVFHASHTSAFVVNQNTNDTTSDSFHRLFFLSKLSFSLLFFLQMIQC